MSRTPVELDFLGLGTAAAPPEPSKSFIRGMQTSAIARIDQELLRRVIAAKPPWPSPPPAAAEVEETAPLTVFYNGSVAVFDLSHDKAEAIMRMATEVSATEGLNVKTGNALAGNFAKDLPLARTKSLQRFLQKRKERLTTHSGPYQRLDAHGVGAVAAVSKKKTVDVKKELV